MWELSKIVRKKFFIDGEDPEPVLCQLHDIFDSELCTTAHNCLGCNFAELIHGLEYAVKSYDNGVDQPLRGRVTQILLSLYLIVEGIDLIFNIIGLPTEVRKEKFPVMRQVNRWANFLKHPKAFLFTHHPQFVVDGEDSVPGDSLCINQEFIDKYYAGDKKNRELYNRMQNKIEVVVKFPRLDSLLKSFAVELHDFMKIIEENPIYKEILGKRSTYENYFEKEDSDL